MSMSEKKYAVGIVPGSFDPITNGHVSVIKRAAELCERVYVAVMINSEKEYMFSLEERLEIAKAACEGMSQVDVISSEGMLYELARELSAEVIVKGVRNDVDREYELRMAEYNREHNPAVTTVLLEAESGLTDVSSTAVRKIIYENGELCTLLPKGAATKIKEIKSRRKI